MSLYHTRSFAYEVSQIEKGRGDARNTDTGNMKKGIATNFGLPASAVEWGVWDPPLQVSHKDEWGFRHEMIAPLLCPGHSDFNDPAYVI